MMFGGMNGKLPSKNPFWKWISCAEGGNNKMSIPNYRERSRLNKSGKLSGEKFIDTKIHSKFIW